MERVIHLLRQQSIRSDGAMNIRSLQRDDDVGKVEIFQDLHVTQRPIRPSLPASPCRTSSADLFRASRRSRRCGSELSAPAPHAPLHECVRGADVAGIQPQLVDAGFERHQGEFVVEVNVGDERNVRHALANLFERDRGIVVRNSQPDDLAAARTISSICATVAPTSAVSVLVID
jgi:hypothetical protein